MTMEPIYTYDKDVDILYISFASGEKATTAVELNENMVIKILTTPPVNQILHVSMYTASLTQPVPIALVSPLPRLLAA